MQEQPAFSCPKTGFRTALIVEDHPLFGDALVMTLQTVEGIETVEHCETLEAALSRIEVGPAPDIVFLDLHLPDVTGLEGLMALRQAAPLLPVVIVTSAAEPRTVRSALLAGAAGFLSKHSRRDLFHTALETIGRGQVFVPEVSLSALIDAKKLTPQDEAIRRLSQLTRQQAKILEQVCAGKMNKQIAHDMSIAETTVKAHITAIMRKLGVYSRTQAVLMAREAQGPGPLSGH
ncbi:response regulator transcription factor [Paracoccus aminophilus]|uniref:Transcriptional regulator, LuxR family n=1 Tax=Paracoccus aminophilus JCM 7686 TaxID=1367847 RepID=S5XV90_PARAH|nr:response regulator transcription factor [Paracoccus aminophilus]AGT07270.1 transcriptional regulator, LuxR family [Paracoccus aminophilus JCM 7686]